MGIKEFVVISGKGGAGKTSVTACLTPYFVNTLTADCDVDAPDLDILLKPVVGKTDKISAARKAVVLSDKCTGCGRCRNVCRFGAVRIEQGLARVDPIKCEGCKVCTLVCPADALSIEDWPTGDLYESLTPYGPMVHARLIPGEEVSGRLVSLVRQRAKAIAAEEGCEAILIDGPPGVACNVISSLTGTDLALIVTEPTVAGFHDMKRVWETAAKLRVKTALVLNKTGLSDEFMQPIRDFAAERDIPILGEIPLSPEMRRAVNDRRIPSVAYPDFPGPRFWEGVVEKMMELV